MSRGQEGKPVSEVWMYRSMDVWQFNNSDNGEISQQPQTDNNNSTIQPFIHSAKNHPTLTLPLQGGDINYSTNTDLSPNRPIAISPQNSHTSIPPLLNSSPFGFLNIYKPIGMTSHDVVTVLRKSLKIKQIGHTGTLDPFAEGVLPIAIGKATRLIEYLPDDKEYLATVQFGKSTNTYDLEGETTFKSDKKITEYEILEKIKDFEGEIEQFPPIFSAIKVKGKKLYEYARKGEDVEIQPRKVVIYNIKLKSFDFELQQAQILIKCSKGTYIRSIANDLGEKLGCGGHLIKLVRTLAGKFRIEDSVYLDDLLKTDKNIDAKRHRDIEAELNNDKNYASNIINPLEMLDMPIVEVDNTDLEKIKNGVNIEGNKVGSSEGRLFNKNSLSEILQIQKNDNSLPSCPPTLLPSDNTISPFVLLVYNNNVICAVGQIENSKIKLKKVFL